MENGTANAGPATGALANSIMQATLECSGLTVAINGRALVSDLDIKLNAGSFICVLGPNGVGKTLTLHTLAGLRPAQDGRINLFGSPLDELDRPAIARRLGLLLQHQEDPFPTTVFETALMGRHPRLKFWQWETGADTEFVAAALHTMDLTDLSPRMAATLSGGERQRLALATLLAQDPDILLLDEPMNHLDPLHKISVLTYLAALATAGKSIVATLHDPALAARVASDILLLFGDGRWEFGPAQAMLTPGKLELLYGTPFGEFTRGDHTVLLPVHDQEDDSQLLDTGGKRPIQSAAH
jgi:iron complex transport system ATP-binding protein